MRQSFIISVIAHVLVLAALFFVVKTVPEMRLPQNIYSVKIFQPAAAKTEPEKSSKPETKAKTAEPAVPKPKPEKKKEPEKKEEEKKAQEEAARARERGNTPGMGMGSGMMMPGGPGGQRDTAALRRMMESNPEMRQRFEQMRNDPAARERMQNARRDTSARTRPAGQQGQAPGAGSQRTNQN